MTATQGQRSNVASLDGRRARAPRRRAETLIADCREMLVEALTDAFPGIMDEVDDALFGLADKAGSDRMQSAYFETMRQIRLERDGLARAFADDLGQRIQSRVERGARSEHGSLAATDEQGLTLVENDDLEESLAVGNMARKVRSVCREELFGLDRRVALLLGDPSIEDESNPLGPEVVCTALGVACKAFDALTEVRLLVMKLFEQRFVRELETLYGDLNTHLVRHGILPDARSTAGAPRRSPPRRREQAPAAGPSAEPVDVPDGGQSQQRTEVIAPPSAGPPPRHADAGLEAGSGGQVASAPGQGPAGGAETVVDLVRALLAQPSTTSPSGMPLASAPVPRERMIAGLTALQHGDPAAGGLAVRPLAASGLEAGTRNVVRELREAGVVSAAARDDAVVIDVVAMLFDYVLGDENVCAAVKAQVGRLQIPVLKVAIADHGFFARKGHPVRRYLDALSAVGLGLDDRDPGAERVLEHVASSVAGILATFDDDTAPFADALDALEAFLARERAESEANVERAARAAADAERMQLARTRAGEEITRRLRGKAVPDVVRGFLDRHWRELLAQRLFTDGEQHEAFTSGLELVDDLLWSVSPSGDDGERREVLDTLPYLVARLKAAQRHLAVPADEADRFMRELADLHLAAVRGGARQAPVAPVVRAVGAVPANRDPELMREAIEGACRVVHAASLADLSRAGMGTTVVAVLARGSALTVGHVGDSRLYRLRGEQFEQVTVDHSMVQELMTKMGISREEASQLAGSNLLTRAIGPDPDVVADLTRIEAEPGDRYLLCSDGLSDLVADGAIETALAADASLESIAGVLVDAANAAGGRDNISVVLLVARAPDEAMEMLGLSDVGRRRAHNEDSILVDAARGIVVLADGMGGHNAGEIASEMTTSHIARVLGASVEVPGEAAGDEGRDTMDDFANAFDVADVEVEVEVQDSGSSRPPETRDAASARALVEALEPGAWVEFERAGYRTRARLVRISEQTGRMLFLDRRGLKVADSTPDGLVSEFREGAARALDESPLLERTMNDVAVHLRGALGAA